MKSVKYGKDEQMTDGQFGWEHFASFSFIAATKVIGSMKMKLFKEHA